MDRSERESLVHSLQFTLSDAEQILREIADYSPDECLEVIQDYLRTASRLADMSAGPFIVSMALRCRVHERLARWVSDNWDVITEGGRRCFLYGAVNQSMNISLEYLLDIYDRKTTTDRDRFGILAGLFAVSKVCGCEQEVERMAKQLSTSSDPEVRQRAGHLARRLAAER